MDTIAVEAVVDNISIPQLQKLYGLSTRQAVYNRLDKLGIKPDRGKITADQLAQMDRLHQELQNPDSKKSALTKSSESTGQIPKSTGQLDNQMMMAMFEMMASRMQPALPAPEPREELRSRLDLLWMCAKDGILLPTSEIAPLLGLSSLNGKKVYERYGYRITKAGKHGSQIAWKIESTR
jgi:hypothetical protein